MMSDLPRGRSPSPSGRLLSKLKSPFGAKARNLSEFIVQPDDPHRQYSAGDTVTGSVILKVIKPFRITHLVCRLHGYVQVYKTPNNPADAYRSYSAALAAGKTRKSGGYYGSGFMSLFEDEVVLCGEGRLGEGTYQFNFELQFPQEKLPSSIDFERGTISYLITSTLTRPTTIGPTTSCDRKVMYQEVINIAKSSQPKPCIILLDPIHRRTRPRRKSKRPAGTPGELQSEERRQSLESGSDQQSAIQRSATLSPGVIEPQSPSPSDVSIGSEPSSGSAVETSSISARTGDSKLVNERIGRSHSHSPRSLKPIKATVELQQAAFLRGDNIQVSIHVHHTKQITSVHGVIVTFYRQARVDMHPALSRAASHKSDEVDLASKPKPGFSGLSISSSASSHLYRKDLSQSFASLIVNPNTMVAEVRATVRVPEGAFPTISTVPGGMIAFKYYVEVVLDLQGKMAGLDRFMPNAGMSGISTHHSDGSMDLPGQTSHSVFAPWGGHFIDTEEIRRDKSVVFCAFEVVVGTRDSERKGKWRNQFPEPPYPGELADTTQTQPPFFSNGQSAPFWEEANAGALVDYEVPSIFRPRADETEASPGYFGIPHHADPAEPPPAISTIPIPEVPAEEPNLSEKERMRLREARLLPSKPPEDGEEFASAGAEHAPSAPDADELLAHDSQALQVPTHEPSEGPSSQQLEDPFATHHPHEIDDASAPAYHEDDRHRYTASSSATNDKQELQRRQLEMERSAPLVDTNEDMDAARPSGAAASLRREGEGHGAPSAPTIEDISLGFASAALHDPHLPRYER